MTKAEQIDIRHDGRKLIILPTSGTINRSKEARKLTARIDKAIEGRHSSPLTDLVVDLTNVSWISSAGLNALIRIRRCSTASGVSMHLSSINETVRDVFRITRLERIFLLDEGSADVVESRSR
ncbi:STAS domain-containing protein [Roseiconus nitratireducens]|uniref:STAS domain-containing protein n=1 Tax=Roseiconus nitratireducens TaxID=2605748 RepID=A0A5M6D154_9BACT|nr:STAS domain-containing protein [Roseiconus nitratireducens]KAA5540012.1 STAS domain-containing protein [Roseiconus nitratireducens]